MCVLALSCGLASGCGDDGAAADDPTPTASTGPSATETPHESTSGSAGGEPSSSQTPEGTVIDVTLADGQVTPNGERVQVEAGEPVTFEVDADAAGELHVHSTPEHSLAFEPGRSTHEIVVDQPGIVEVELHDPALVVVQLEVR